VNEVFVFTFKEGLLSPLAHDLKLRVSNVVIERDGDRSVRAAFDAGSLQVVEAGNLPRHFYAEIERTIRNEVLQVKKHPSIRFESTSISDREVVGQLTLMGHTREIRCPRKDDATHLGIEVRLDQRDFGMKPYTAMLGTLKVKPEVMVRVRLPR
jgi:hypothetical protein